MRIKRLLVPTDLSPVSSVAMDYAARLARSLGAEIELLLVDETGVAIQAGAFDTGAAALAMEDARRTMHRELERKAAALRKAGLKVRSAFIAGTAYRRIVETAARRRVDWIVIGTHGRTGLARAFLGSVAERVVRHAGCPVLTVPSRRPAPKRTRRRKRRA